MATERLIRVAQPEFSGNEAAYVLDCIETEWVTAGGKYVKSFESAFAEWIGVRHAIACSSGTSALHLALLAFGAGPGDEVLVPTLTYVATANAVRYCNATPVFCESEADTMNIDPDDIEDRITAKTVGIVPVHMYGHSVDMKRIREIAGRHGLWVAEDAAQAHGATYNGISCGSLGDIGTFSFFGNKIMTTGEGGMVVTDDDDYANAIRLYAGQGVDANRRYWFSVVGYNYRMTNVQAALGVAQLERIDDLLVARQRVAQWYAAQLKPMRDVLTLPVQWSYAHHAYWMYTVVLNEGVALSRDDLILKLAEDGIETRPVFHPVHTLPPYEGGRQGQYPIAERLGRRGISLPTHSRLSEEDVVYVCERLQHHMAQAS
jgi:perosamine synthetase